jgi:hypothetical protein
MDGRSESRQRSQKKERLGKGKTGRKRGGERRDHGRAESQRFVMRRCLLPWRSGMWSAVAWAIKKGVKKAIKERVWEDGILWRSDS